MECAGNWASRNHWLHALLPIQARHACEAFAGIELWGGVECTINRVRDDYHTQLERSGHDRRIDDLDRIAELGVKALRYPVLWERTAADGLESAGWSWSD